VQSEQVAKPKGPSGRRERPSWGSCAEAAQSPQAQQEVRSADCGVPAVVRGWMVHSRTEMVELGRSNQGWRVRTRRHDLHSKSLEHGCCNTWDRLVLSAVRLADAPPCTAHTQSCMRGGARHGLGGAPTRRNNS